MTRLRCCVCDYVCTITYAYQSFRCPGSVLLKALVMRLSTFSYSEVTGAGRLGGGAAAPFTSVPDEGRCSGDACTRTPLRCCCGCGRPVGRQELHTLQALTARLALDLLCTRHRKALHASRHGAMGPWSRRSRGWTVVMDMRDAATTRDLSTALTDPARVPAAS